MDCEKFEPLLLDELYGELDELKSASVKRHVSGCARCSSVFNGLLETRRLAVLPLVEPPEGLEDRILAAARDAQKVVPIRGRFGRAVSWAGSWAMRPQTAMAAVFLLMIGTGTFLLRSKTTGSPESAVSVTVQGSPSPTTAATTATAESLDDKAAAAAHGPSSPNVTAPPAASATAAATQGALALGGDEDQENGLMDRVTRGAARDKKNKDDNALASALAASDDQGGGQGAGKKEEREQSKSGVAGGGRAPPSDISNAGAPGGAPYGATQFAQAPAPPPLSKRAGPSDPQSQDPFSLGTAAFRARNFAEATRQFDQAAQIGDQNAALWAARSTKEGNGCAVALGRFERVAQAAAGAWIGHEASLEAARCQIAMGQLDPARDRLNRLAHVASHQAQAQQALNELNQVAARKDASGASAGGAAAPRRSAAPAPRPASARPSGGEKASEKKAVDHAEGF